MSKPIDEDDVETAWEDFNLFKCSSASELSGCDLGGKLYERVW